MAITAIATKARTNFATTSMEATDVNHMLAAEGSESMRTMKTFCA